MCQHMQRCKHCKETGFQLIAIIACWRSLKLLMPCYRAYLIPVGIEYPNISEVICSKNSLSLSRTYCFGKERWCPNLEHVSFRSVVVSDSRTYTFSEGYWCQMCEHVFFCSGILCQTLRTYLVCVILYVRFLFVQGIMHQIHVDYAVQNVVCQTLQKTNMCSHAFVSRIVGNASFLKRAGVRTPDMPISWWNICQILQKYEIFEGTWKHFFGNTCLLPGLGVICRTMFDFFMELMVWYQVPCIWYEVPGISHQVPSTRYQGTWKCSRG